MLVKSNLTLAYALSSLLAVLLLVSSVVGLPYENRYLEYIPVLLELKSYAGLCFWQRTRDGR